MRITRTLWLLSLLTGACAHSSEGSAAQEHVFRYKSPDGGVATLDLSKKTITFGGEVIVLTDCSDSEQLCLQSPKAKIVIPKECSAPKALESYISSSDDLEFIGLEGLSGSVFKAFKATGKFGYAYNLNAGLVQLILIPASSEANILENRSVIPQYTFRIPIKKAPLACKRKRIWGR